MTLVDQVYAFQIYMIGINHYLIKKYGNIVEEYNGSLNNCRDHIFKNLI